MKIEYIFCLGNEFYFVYHQTNSQPHLKMGGVAQKINEYGLTYFEFQLHFYNIRRKANTGREKQI